MDKKIEDQVNDFEKRGEVAIVEAPAPSLIQMAIENKYDPEFISRMMDLQERNEERLAKQAYIVAMAAFKKNPPKIIKDKSVAFQPSGKPKVEYAYADLATSLDVINTELSPHGLFASWTTDQANGNITVTCVIAHEMGHTESTKLTAGPDDTGSKNKIQAMGSTIYYLMRYTLFALLGLAAHGDDTDGVGSGEVEYINKVQLKTINDLIKVLDANLPVYLEFLSKTTGYIIESTDKIPAKEFNRAMKELGRKKKDAPTKEG